MVFLLLLVDIVDSVVWDSSMVFMFDQFYEIIVNVCFTFVNWSIFATDSRQLIFDFSHHESPASSSMLQLSTSRDQSWPIESLVKW